MSDDDIPEVIGCLRVTQGPPRVLGAKVETCPDCREQIWVAPSSAAIRSAHPTVETICVQCAIHRARLAGESIEIMPMLPEQQQEAREYRARQDQSRNN